MTDPHWYVMSRIGLLTLCADEADARESAGRFDKEWPDAAPHRAVQLVAVEDMDAMLAERDRLREALLRLEKGFQAGRDNANAMFCESGNMYHEGRKIAYDQAAADARAALAQEVS